MRVNVLSRYNLPAISLYEVVRYVRQFRIDLSKKINRSRETTVRFEYACPEICVRRPGK